MKEISRTRFDAFAGYARDPRTILVGEEVRYYEHADARVVGVVVRDRTDGDFAGIVFAPDELGQYRWTSMTKWSRTARHAKALLRPALEQAAMAPAEEHHQGHQNPRPVDFFRPVVSPDRQSGDFRKLVGTPNFLPARRIIEPMMRWYEDVDGNFIEQFQTTAFDARMWELYLFAVLVELGFAFDRSQPAPDFVASSLRGQFALEAVTVNPTKDARGSAVAPPPTETTEQKIAFLKEYMPIKFGSALYSKLGKKYWQMDHVRDLPFALAIEDFSSAGSMVRTRSALQLYLFGFDHEVVVENGVQTAVPLRVETHRWLGKEIPSGFFRLPEAKNVSFVLFSNSGTISKFNRMGVVAGFAQSDIQMFRKGLAYNHAPSALAPTPFTKDVMDLAYRETWVEGLDVFHNPAAIRPVDRSLLPGAAHHYLQPNGVVRSFIPDWHPLGSYTQIRSSGNSEGL